MALSLKLKPRRTLTLAPFRPFSSSDVATPSPPSDADQGGAAENENSAALPPPPPPPTQPAASYSLFSEIKERLKSPPSPPRRIPLDPPKPPPISSPSAAPTVSLEEIRKRLGEFRVKTSKAASGDRPASSPTISFGELFKSNVLNKEPGGGPKAPEGGKGSYDSIREKLRQFMDAAGDQPGPRTRDRTQPFSSGFRSFNDSFRDKIGAKDVSKGPSILSSDKLPESIFGPELREREEGKGESKNELRTDFIKMYNYDELGDKLRKLRPEAAAKSNQEQFSLTELNERLAKLRELEEKETESNMAGISFKDLRESLHKLKETETKEANKKTAMQRISIFASLTGNMTPTYMLKPPQENLLERYFHPDHMSSAEKLKLELQRVRDEFKMSESDCGSTRVQVAQLTTKIKHLSSVLHKKDKHSKKGLKEMVQRRKKLLKYLRRTDWDSYCLVLSKLGLRDVPEYKVPDYKS